MRATSASVRATPGRIMRLPVVGVWPVIACNAARPVLSRPLTEAASNGLAGKPEDGELDGWCQQLSQRQRPKAIMQCLPAIDASRDGDSIDVVAMADAAQTSGAQPGSVCARTGPSAGVEREHVAVNDHQREEVTTDTAQMGADDSHGGIGRNRGVDGVSATLQHGQTGLCCESVCCCDSAVGIRGWGTWDHRFTSIAARFEYPFQFSWLSVMMPSTPRSSKRSISNGSSIVHTCTWRPRRWAAEMKRLVTSGTRP